APAGNVAETGEDLRKHLYAAMPELRDAAQLWWPSASSCIYNEATSTEVSGIRGQRLYVLISDARDVPKVGDLLASRLWLIGRGRCDVSTSGSLLERTLVDGAVFQPERLDFAAGARCEAPLIQRRGMPMRYGTHNPLNSKSL